MCGKRSVPSDWSDAVLIPIPKKGDLSHYDNWRGISLLNIIRKDVARTSKIGCRSWPRMSYLSRNVVLGRERLPGHNFTVCQLVEKSMEHKSKAFFTFIDLKKAYESVPRQAMWIVLANLGEPEETVQLIKSFHQDMKAKIHIDGAMLEEIEVVNGLRQGCCMAPMLFNLYSCLAVERWLAKIENVEGVVISIRYKNDKKLFRR